MRITKEFIKEFIKESFNQENFKNTICYLAVILVFLFFIFHIVSGSVLQNGNQLSDGNLYIDLEAECSQEPAFSINAYVYRGTYPDTSHLFCTGNFGSDSCLENNPQHFNLEYCVQYVGQNNPVDNTDYWVNIVDYTTHTFDYYYLAHRYSLNNWSGAICDINNLNYCFNQASCINAGGNWSIVLNKCLDYNVFYDCNTGINLQFCDNEASCSYYGGFWRQDLCFEIVENIVEFNDYYLQHSSFSESTGLISSLASISIPVIEIANNLVAIFENNFNVASASVYGYMFGSAIPQARGYLDIINDFFGGLPVGEFLLLFVFVLVILSVYKLVIRLIHLIKP
jgi:hypothetical protein